MLSGLKSDTRAVLKSYLLCSVRVCPLPSTSAGAEDICAWQWDSKPFKFDLTKQSHCGGLEVKGEKKRDFTVLSAAPVAVGKTAFCPPGHSTGGLCWGKQPAPAAPR